MPRRLLREGILESRTVNAMTESGEILYRRLMSVVDDYGRFEADLDILRARCFPLQLDRWPVDRIALHLKEISCGSPLIFVKDGKSPTLTVENGGSPPVTVYVVGQKRYLQINNFGQRVQSKARFPAPGSVDVPPNPDIPVTSKKSESKVESNGNGNGHHSAPSWVLDESYVEFADLSRKLWPRILSEEIDQGYSFHWNKLSFEQKILATKNLRDRVDSGEDGEYVKHMPDYLKSEWKRGPKPKEKRGSPVGDSKSAYEPLPVYEPPKD